MIEIIWDTLKTDLLDYFDGTGDSSLNYAPQGATHSRYKLENVLIWNDQEATLEEQTQYNYPLIYVEFNENIEIKEMAEDYQWAPVEFTLRFRYKTFQKAEERLEINRFMTEITNYTTGLARLTADFDLSEIRRISVSKSVDNDMISGIDTTFRCNVFDKSGHRQLYGNITAYGFTLTMVLDACGRDILIIDGGDSGDERDRLIGKLDGECVDLDGVDGGNSYPDEDIDVDGGNSTSR